MRIFIALTYYRPHYSGLTLYAERTARALAACGHQVTVLTSRYSEDLPLREERDGVDIVRLPVLARISKGVIMPGIGLQAWRLARQADVIHLHLPQLDAALISLIGRVLGKPVVLTYHCDLHLPGGWVHWVANQVSHLANHISALAAHTIVTNTRDYAENSSFLSRYLHKVHPILPPAEVAQVSEADKAAFREKAGIRPGQRVIGMAARLATEKGVEYLAQALPIVMEKHPTARVIFAGQHENVFGEEPYALRLAPLIRQLGEHWRFMGNLEPVDWAAFFHACELTVLPSLNSTESFGMVQVESMMCGTPVVASDLPGVRQPVMLTGMGRTVPAANTQALAEAIIAVLDRPQDYGSGGGPPPIAQSFTPEAVARAYEQLFGTLLPAQALSPAKASLPDQGRDFLWVHLRDLPYFRAILRAVEAHYYQDFALQPPVLDVGCGDGHFASVVFERPLDVGIDPWTGPIRQAGRLGGYRRLVQGDGGRMPFPEAYFGSALSNSVLEHIPHVQQVLAETCRVLQPGGLFLFCVPNPGYLAELSVPKALHGLGLGAAGEAYRAWFRRMSRVEHAEPVAVWRAWLEQAGLELERWWHYFPPAAMRALEWGHYFGAPTLLPHLLTRRWILAPYTWNLSLTRRLVERFADPTPHAEGVFTFYVARKPQAAPGKERRQEAFIRER